MRGRLTKSVTFAAKLGSFRGGTGHAYRLGMETQTLIFGYWLIQRCASVWMSADWVQSEDWACMDAPEGLPLGATVAGSVYSQFIPR